MSSVVLKNLVKSYDGKKNIIDKLNEDLKKEPDPMKQASIIAEMMKIRGVKNNDWRNQNIWTKKRRIN